MDAVDIDWIVCGKMVRCESQWIRLRTIRPGRDASGPNEQPWRNPIDKVRFSASGLLV